MEKQIYEPCKSCGSERVLNPKTGKVFCKAKCWLNGDNQGTPEAPRRPYTPKTVEPNWDAIQANKEEGMRFLNSLNNAATLLSGAIQAGLSLEEALNQYESVAQKIYELGSPKK